MNTNVFRDILNDFKTYFNIKTKYGRKHTIVLALILLVSFVGYKIFGQDKPEEVLAEQTLAEVEVLSVAELGVEAKFNTIGKVEAISEANLQAEAGGRVTGVNVKIGDNVTAGMVLATIENNGERATLTQAQGAYEAALAASAQSGVGVGEAKTRLETAQNGAVNDFRSAYNTVNGIIYNNVDTFFSNPTGSIPGLRIGGTGFNDTLNSERVAYQQILIDWQARSNNINTNSDLKAEIAYAKTQVERTISLLDTFITAFGRQNDSKYADGELQTFSANFTNLRSSLIGTRSALDGALAGIAAAEDGVKRAGMSASGGKNSAADAQVKIALGSLQAAQANFQKTIVRSPIQGVVNAFYLKVGDYAAPNQAAGIVANNNGLQIKTYVSEIDSTNLNVGDKVKIEDNASGVITAKAAALDPVNGKVAIVVGVNPDSGLTNGATVNITFAQISDKVVSDKILVPLSALKITPAGTFVFTLGENNVLVAVPVTQGQLYGENIELTEGVNKETRIIIDARGLKDGQTVTVKD